MAGELGVLLTEGTLNEADVRSSPLLMMGFGFHERYLLLGGLAVDPWSSRGRRIVLRGPSTARTTLRGPTTDRVVLRG